MNLCVFDIPEETTDLARWLEGHLAGPELGNLASELAAIHVTPALDGRERKSLEQMLGKDLSRIVDTGLQGMSRPVLQSLLQNPELLLALQARLLISGSEYWQSRFQNSAAAAGVVEQGWRRLQPSLTTGSSGTGAVVPQVVPRRSSAKWIVRLALAAAVVIVVTSVSVKVFRPQPPQVAQGWGWNKPDAFPQDLAAKPYLQHLAKDAEEWFKKRPENRDDLAKRITQFRHGCEMLLQAEHKPLAPADREWLRERCRTWSGKLDQHLADLNAGQDVVKVRGEADATIQKLIQALRGRLT